MNIQYIVSIQKGESVTISTLNVDSEYRADTIERVYSKLFEADYVHALPMRRHCCGLLLNQAV